EAGLRATSLGGTVWKGGCKSGEVAHCACDAGRERCRPEDIEGVLNQGFSAEIDECLIAAHAPGAPPGEDEPLGGRIPGVRQAQRPASSRKRIRERMPSSK